MSGHALEFTGDPTSPWRLICNHGPEAFRSTLEDGTDDGTGECWITSWWSEMGEGLLAQGPWPAPVAPFRLPIAVEGNGWDWGPMLVPAEATR